MVSELGDRVVEGLQAAADPRFEHRALDGCQNETSERPPVDGGREPVAGTVQHVDNPIRPLLENVR
jgi:hypothetical protein